MEADKNGKYDEEKKDKSTVFSESASSAVPLKKTEHVSDEEEDIFWSSDDSDSDEEYVCTLSNKTFSGFIPLKQHEKSGSHLKKKLKKKLEKKLEKEIVKLEKLEDDEEENLDFVKEAFAACKTCKKSFSDPLSYHKHLISKKHKRKAFEAKILDQVKNNGDVESEALKKMLQKIADPTKERKDNTEASDSYEGILNDLKVKLSVSKAEGKNSESDSSDDTEEFSCTDCDKYFSSLVTYFQHMTSKSHKKKVKQQKMLEQLTKSEKEPEVVVDISSIETEDDILMCKLCSTAFSGPESAFAHLKSKGHKKKLEVLKWKRSHRQKREMRSKSFTSHEEHPQDLANTEYVSNEMKEISAADSNNKDLDSKQSLKSDVKKLPSSPSYELGENPKETIISATRDSQQKVKQSISGEVDEKEADKSITEASKRELQQDVTEKILEKEAKPNIIEASLQKEAKQNIKEAQGKEAKGNIVEEKRDIKQNISEAARGKESRNEVHEEVVEVKEGKIAPEKYKVYKKFMSSFHPNTPGNK